MENEDLPIAVVKQSIEKVSVYQASQASIHDLQNKSADLLISSIHCKDRVRGISYLHYVLRSEYRKSKRGCLKSDREIGRFREWVRGNEAWFKEA